MIWKSFEPSYENATTCPGKPAASPKLNSAFLLEVRHAVGVPRPWLGIALARL
jgi:hypothetical protein